MKDLELCWRILPEVSRSFSLCIRILPKPLGEQIMLSYLIFRVIDTIEDSHAPLKAKKALFDGLLKSLKARSSNPRAESRLKAALCTKLDYTYEKNLLANSGAVLHAYYAQPAKVRLAIRKRARTMARGMYAFQKKGIDTFADQNRYSYYVAGVIGYLFNDLLYYNKIITRRLKARLHRHAVHFGLALQKVNILRDIAQDIAANRHYWPSLLLKKYGLSYESICSEENRAAALRVLRKQIDQARKYLISAMKGILLIPRKALRVRMACLIPLFMAIESYVKCLDNYDIFDPGKRVKITRLQVGEIVAKSSMWGGSNERLARWFISSMAKASPDFYRECASIFPYRHARP